MARFCPVCAGLTEFGEPGEPCPDCLDFDRGYYAGGFVGEPVPAGSPPAAGVEVREDDGWDVLFTDYGGES